MNRPTNPQPAQKTDSEDGFAEREQRGIQSIEVGGEILKVLASEPRPMAMRELVKKAQMPSGKIHPYLVSLSKVGLVSQDPVTGYYKVGPMAIRLGLIGLQSLNPIREAMPFAEALASESTHNVAMTIWGDLGPVVVQMFDGAYALHTNMRIGSLMSLAATATGRLFVAFLPRQMVDGMLLDDRMRLGPNIAEPLDKKMVEDLIQEARENRMSRGVNYPTPGIAAFSAPVFDYTGKMVLAVTLSGPTGMFDTNWDGKDANALRLCTDTISERLGAPTARSVAVAV
ncbi:IclR family transcriptional regulator [Variovorax sp. J31P179]|uniref:IclR family transcriptional regulator n=1 Tax=Variovorax sp. J31P179 TaxID=3053508 RepID=UPI00257887B2|nr:IclR family transcriptional regulator [Variovorax sp. J31P179]MDM0085388.1 IclR family transcriptional regulator [Variovorax sp. J31P179]